MLSSAPMSAYDERSLRRLFRQMVWVVATASGCGASVTVSVGDAAVDASPPVDVAAPGDVPTLADVPVVRDVPVVTDRGACDPIRTVSNPSTLCPSGTVVFPCGLPPELLLDAGESIVDQTLCATLCQLPTAMFGSPYCSLATTPEGARSLNCQIPCPGGRRPEGFCDVALDGPETTGAWFARLAALESASVTAFDRMVFELTLHGAPADLIAGARAAVVEERRHTALTVGLARAFGREPALPVTAPAAPRPLAAVALDNAVEGCVRETYGALVATWQAAHASDPRVAAAMAVIADDETRHAALSWALHAWVAARLDAGARAALDRAMQAAVRALRQELAGDVGADLVATAGLPTREQQASLLDALTDSFVGLA